MNIEQEIEHLDSLIKTSINDPESESFSKIMPQLERINSLFQTLSDDQKADLTEAFDKIYSQLKELKQTQINFQAQIKKDIGMIDKRSNAFNAYGNASKLGS